MTTDTFVEGLSARDIEIKTLAWREAFDLADQWVPNVADILEFKLPRLFPDFALIVRHDRTMDDAEAYTQFEPPLIAVRETVCRGAIALDPRCRMTCAHELGHLVLHKGMGKARGITAEPSEIKPFNSAEWQARKFAAFFLMPSDIVRLFESPAEMAANCRVSIHSATIRFDEVGHKKSKALPSEVQDFLARR